MGPWTLIKVSLVEKYLRFFNTALKNKPFERVYIDAFAGSGSFQYGADARMRDLFAVGKDLADIHSGSAKRALRVNPPFHKVFFVETRKANVAALKTLIDETRHPAARVEHGNANDVLRKICRREHWRTRRGVIFLDPFGLEVEWGTLEKIADTRALDVWYLFPLAGLFRNLPRSADRLDSVKRSAVTRLLGTTDWFEKFYKPATPEATLFANGFSPVKWRRTAAVSQIESYVGDRLRTIFAHVEQPMRLGPRQTPLFSLFFAVSNPSEKAINLARKAAARILSRK